MSEGFALGSAYGSIALDGSGMSATITSLQKQLQGFGTAMSLGVTAPLLAFGGVALDSAGDFEQSMDMIAQATQGSAADMAALQAQALQLGAETSFSAGEAAAAMLELGKSGMSLAEVSAGIGGVLDLAAAGGLGLADAAAIAANTVNAFNLAASETPAIANMLAAAANASSADVSDLAAGMQQAGAVFASNEQSVLSLASSMAILANNGIAGSDAGTSLKTMLMSLAAPTDKARGVLNDLGIAVYDNQGQMRDFELIIGDLSTATTGMSDAQRNAAFATIFGSDAIRAASILSREGAAGFAEMAAAVGAQGAAAEAAGARMAGFNGAVEYLKGSLDSFLIETALPFLNSMSGIVRGAADAIALFGSLPEPVTNAGLAFAGVLAAAGPLALGISGVSAALGVLLSPIGLVTVGVGALAAAWTLNLGGIQEITAAVVGPVVEGLTSLAAPVQSVATAMLTAGVNSTEASEAITALPATLQPVATGFQNLVGGVAAMGATLTAFFAPAVQRVQEAFAALPDALSPILPKLGETGAAFGRVVEALQPLLMLLGAGLAAAAALGVNAFAAVIDNLPGIVGPAVDQVTATLELISGVVNSMVRAVRAAIDGDWGGVWEAAKDSIAAFNTYFRGLFSRLGTFAGSVAGIIYDAFVDTLGDLGIDIVPILEGIQATFKDIWDRVVTTFAPVLSAIDGLKQGIQDFADWIGGLHIDPPWANWSMPDVGAMMGGAGNFFSGGGADGNPATPEAGGTSYFVGGLAQINERGYEQIYLPPGSRVMTNAQTNQMQREEPRQIVINVDVKQMANELDGHRLAGIIRDRLAMEGI